MRSRVAQRINDHPLHTVRFLIMSLLQIQERGERADVQRA